MNLPERLIGNWHKWTSMKIPRGKEAEGTIPWFSDIENRMSDPNGKEFVGYEAVSSSSDDDHCGEEAEDSLEEVHSQSSLFIPPLTMGWYSLMHRTHTKNSRQKWQPSKRSYWEQRGKAAVRVRSKFEFHYLWLGNDLIVMYLMHVITMTGQQRQTLSHLDSFLIGIRWSLIRWFLRRNTPTFKS